MGDNTRDGTDEARPPWRRRIDYRGARWVLGAAVVLLLGLGLYASGALGRYAAPLAPPTYGRIYVESPEVYTRQRLVNDRLAQDAWLNKQLDGLDEDTSSFVAAWSEQRLKVELALMARGAGRVAEVGDAASGAGADAAFGTGSDAGSDTGAADAEPAPLGSPAPWWSETPDAPFQVQFDLKAAARDKIRQLLLENALDDRHDLSGNTVYGLKFDTAIVPGSNTTLRPTVIIKMRMDPFPEPETDGSAEAVLSPSDRDRAIERAIVLGSAGLTPEHHAEAFSRLRVHFENWHRNIGVRLNDYLEGAACYRDPTVANAGDMELLAGVDARVEDRLAALKLAMMSDTPEAKDEVFGQAPVEPRADMPEPTLLDACLATDLHLSKASFPRELDSAVRHVLSLPNHAPNSVIEKMLANPNRGRLACQALYGGTGPAASVYNDFGVSLPDPWGKFFQLSVDIDPIGFSVLPRVRRLLITDTDLARLGGEGASSAMVPGVLQKKRCAVASDAEGERLDCSPADAAADADFIYVYEEHGDLGAPEAREPLDFSDAEVSALHENSVEERFCVSTLGPIPEQFVPGGDRATMCENKTFMGRRVVLQSGLYEFARRVREIDTYAYAAFPRGDVSGVVSEASHEIGVSAGGALPAGRIGVTARDDERTRSIEAKPMLVNFAAGEDSGEMFDFGWTVVKEGRKQPMMASQLVLVSVPAYLDKIEMEVTKGWLDSDVVLEGNEEWEDFKTLDTRVEKLLREPETITTTVHFPPDYQALDSLVAPAASRLGPLINLDAMVCAGAGSDDSRPSAVFVSGEAPSIVIPGARLWRSTVVTLGGYKATEIEVMPDMRGIIARFAEITVADASGSDEDAALRPDNKLDLIVWTSEGKDVIPDFATVIQAPGSPSGTTDSRARTEAEVKDRQ